MRKVLKLLAKELRFLKKTAILSAVILTIFLSAALGILSVYGDLMSNLCMHLDEREDKCFVSAKNASLAIFGEDGLTYGSNHSNDELSFNGNRFDGKIEVSEIVDGEQITVVHMSQPIAVTPNETFRQLTVAPIEGRWLQNEGEICLLGYVADILQSSVGDNVTLGNIQLTVVGIYAGDADLTPYIYSAPANVQLDWVRHYAANSAETFQYYRALTRRGYDMEIQNDRGLYDAVNTMQATFAAITAALAAVILGILYSLTSVTFRQRKEHICRLEMLGATRGVIAAVYCGIIWLLLAAVTLCSAGLGYAFGAYFSDLCSTIFGFAFTSRFRFIYPVIAFAVLGITTAAIWYITNARTRSGELAKEVRCE